MRHAALDVLVQVAERGSQGALDSVYARLEHTNWFVRNLALNALWHLAEKHDEQAMIAAARRLVDNDERVWKVAMVTFDHLADKVRDKGPGQEPRRVTSSRRGGHTVSSQNCHDLKKSQQN